MTTKTPEQIRRAWTVLDHVFAHLDQWYQDAWLIYDAPYREIQAALAPDGTITLILDGAPVRDPDCGTAACLAGWTTLLNGHALHRRYDGNVYTEDDTPVADAAADLLGLTADETNELFLELDGELWACSACSACSAVSAAALDSRLAALHAIRRIFGPRPDDMPIPADAAAEYADADAALRTLLTPKPETPTLSLSDRQ